MLTKLEHQIFRETTVGCSKCRFYFALKVTSQHLQDDRQCEQTVGTALAASAVLMDAGQSALSLRKSLNNYTADSSQWGNESNVIRTFGVGVTIIYCHFYKGGTNRLLSWCTTSNFHSILYNAHSNESTTTTFYYPILFNMSTYTIKHANFAVKIFS